MLVMTFDEKRDFVCKEVAPPVRKDGEVIIDIHAAGLNRADLLQRAGNYPPPPGWPEWPGLECAGVISEVGANSRWQVGDEVCALLGGGGYAEKISVPEELILPLPKGYSMIEGAALPEVFATAYLNLFLEAGMKEGDTVLIQAGASGLGIAAIQLAKAIGAKVVTTVGSEDKAAFVEKLGADIIVRRKEEKLSEVLAKQEVDIALDCVGGEAFGECFETMAHGGRWVLIATLAGNSSEVALRQVLMKNLRLIGSTLRSRSNEVKGKVLKDLEDRFWPELEKRKLFPVIYEVLPAQNAQEAQQILVDQKNIGKVILTWK